MMKSFQFALLLALLLPAAVEVSADSRPSKPSSYKSGFSSQKSQPTSSNRSSPASRNSSFGSFGNRQAAPPPRAPAPAAPSQGRNGGFGSFGNAAPRQDNSAAPAPRKSDSALSQSMNKSNSEANALRTLEARRAAQAAANAPRDIRPVPSGPLPSNSQNNSQNNGQYGGQYDAQNRRQNDGQYAGRSASNGQYGGGMQAPPAQQNSGLMNVITGFLLAKAVSNTHAQPGNNNGNHNGSYNGNNGNADAASSSMGNSGMAAAAGANAIPVQSAPKGSFMMSVLRTMAWLAIIAVLGWLVYFGWKFLRRGKAPSAANYSFERN